jgi:arylsulfatase
MVEHDGHVGQLLKKLDELGLDENTIVIYSTDNGADLNTWPDAGTTPFRGEKNTNWEGGYRVPAMVRWPGHGSPGHGDQRHLRGTRTGCRRCSPPPAIRPQEDLLQGRGASGRQAVQGASRRLRPRAGS